jgi:hypothetical protein
MFSLAIIAIIGGIALILYALECSGHWAPGEPTAGELIATGAGLSVTGLVALAILVVGWPETVFWVVFIGGAYWFGVRVCAPWEHEEGNEE